MPLMLDFSVTYITHFIKHVSIHMMDIKKKFFEKKIKIDKKVMKKIN